MSEPRRIEYMPVADLPPDPANPKAHWQEGIGRSIARLGFVEPVVLDERTGLLISGHGRREELLRAEADGGGAPEGIVVGDDGRWTVPVSRGWASADDAHARAALVALNRIGERGGWQEALLLPLLEGAAEMDLLAVAGFDDSELARLRERFRPDSPSEFPEIDPDALTIEHRCPKCGYEWSGDPAPG